MTTDEGVDHDGLVCTTPDCGGRIEANMKAGFTLYRDGSWELTYMGDDHGTITCDAEEHDNCTTLLDKSLTAYVETILPGTTWQGSDPAFPLGDSVDAELTPQDIEWVSGFWAALTMLQQTGEPSLAEAIAAAKRQHPDAPWKDD